MTTMPVLSFVCGFLSVLAFIIAWDVRYERKARGREVLFARTIRNESKTVWAKLIAVVIGLLLGYLAGYFVGWWR